MTERYPVFLVNKIGYDYFLIGRCKCEPPLNRHEISLGYLSVDVNDTDQFGELPDEWPTSDSPCDVCCQDIYVSGRVGHSVYSRPDTGGVYSRETGQLPPGACYFVEDSYCAAPDGTCLVVVTPDGSWYVDSRASNCTMPDDKEHRCWVRHGHPSPGHPDGPLHVDKNGLTCAAGAGSIQMRDWHGFLHHGELYRA